MLEETILAIAKRVATTLKLNDEGRINRFYKKEIKKFESFQSDLKHEKETITRDHNRTLEKLKENLEDAEIALKEAFEDIDVEAIKTNSGCEDFSEKFWKRIDMKEMSVKDLKDNIEDVEKQFKSELEEIEEQIIKYQTRIDRVKN